MRGPFAVVVRGPHRIAFAGTPENVAKLVPAHDDRKPVRVLLPDAWRESDAADLFDWSEYDAAAEWCARRGIVGRIGDPLPAMLSGSTCRAIDADPEAFERRVRETAYGLAMLGRSEAN